MIDTWISSASRALTEKLYPRMYKNGQMKTLILVIIVAMAIVLSVILIMRFRKGMDQQAGGIFDNI